MEAAWWRGNSQTEAKILPVCSSMEHLKYSGGLLLGLSLGHLAGHPDGFLGLVLVSVLNLTVQDQPQNLIENLFLGPPVVDTGDLRPGGQLDLVGLAVPGGPDLDVGDQLAH